MNVLRRVLLAVYSVLLIAACVGLAVLAWNQDQQLDISPGDFRLLASINSSDGAKWLFTLLMGLIALFGLLTLLLAVMRGRAGQRGRLRLRQNDGGTVEVTSDALESLLRDELERLPEIRRADPQVRLGRGGAVDTDVRAVIEPSASIAHVTNLIGVTTSSALREQVGVTNVHRPNVRIEYDEMNARPVAVRERRGRRVRPETTSEEPWPAPPADLQEQQQTPAAEADQSWPEPPPDLQPENDQASTASQTEGAKDRSE